MRLLLLVPILALAAAPSRAGERTAKLLGLREPVDVVDCGMCLDGGSTKGMLRDANGAEYHFFIDRRFTTKDRNRWYVGADFNTGRAEPIGHGDWRKNAIRQILSDWLDRVASSADQEHLRTLDSPEHFPGESSRDMIFESTKWYVATTEGTLF